MIGTEEVGWISESGSSEVHESNVSVKHTNGINENLPDDQFQVCTDPEYGKKDDDAHMDCFDPMSVKLRKLSAVGADSKVAAVYSECVVAEGSPHNQALLLLPIHVNDAGYTQREPPSVFLQVQKKICRKNST